MTDEWVDITDGQNTKWFKRIKIAQYVVKIGVIVFFVMEAVAIATVLKITTPYVSDAELVMDHVWTNSQITAIIQMFVLCGTLIIFAKMVKKVL